MREIKIEYILQDKETKEINKIIAVGGSAILLEVGK